MKRTILIVVSSVLVLGGCKKDPAWKTKTYVDQNVKPQTGEAQIPASLWTKILALNVGPEKPPGHKDDKKEEGESSIPETILEPLKIYLAVRNDKSVLKGQNVALTFVAGGGTIELSDFVAPLRGSYFIASEFLPGNEKADTKVFFLSNSVIRTVGGEQLGSGCNTYFDLTKRFTAAMKRDGFLVNTSDQRDVSALASTYVFVSTFDGKFHMATLVIKDDGHRALQCRH
jgi:hypothetical protein